MNVPHEITQMEAGLAKAGLSAADLCRKAGIANSTWGRWKNGSFQPRMRVWTDVKNAFDKLTQATQ